MTQWCNICGNEDNFLVKDLEREGHVCANCNASSRLRGVIYTLGKCLGMGDATLIEWKADRSIYILESSGRSFYPTILKEKFSYVNTEYKPGSELMNHPYTPDADFEHLAYNENELDIVIATDVFEHVRHDELGFREIYRVLKQGGFFILTVPYVHSWSETLVRVSVQGDKDIHLLPPEYHGGGGQTLSYRTYGRDLLDRLHSYGFSVGYLELNVPLHDIGKQSVFVCCKSGYVDMTNFHVPPDAQRVPHHLKASPLLLFRLFTFLKYNVKSASHFMSEISRKLTDAFKK